MRTKTEPRAYNTRYDRKRTDQATPAKSPRSRYVIRSESQIQQIIQNDPNAKSLPQPIRYADNLRPSRPDTNRPRSQPDESRG